MSKSRNKNKIPKPRNWLAIHAFQRSGSGSHGDKKKQRKTSRGIEDVNFALT